MNVTEILRRQARARPDAPAVAGGAAIHGIAENRVYSYAELDRVVDAIAIRAMGWGVAPGEHVALLLKGQMPNLLLRLGLARAGIPYSNLTYPGDRALRIRLRRSEDSPDERAIIAAPEWWSEASDRPAPMHAGGDALLQRQGTSGTSGMSKLVPVSHAMYTARWQRTIGVPLPREPRLLCVSGPSGLGFGYALSVFEAGGMVALLGPGDDPLTLVERHRVGVLVASPYAIAATIGRRPADAPPPATLEQVVLSGSRLSAETIRLVSERLRASVVCMYGSTEAGPLAAGAAAAMSGIDGATGYVLPGVEVQPVDERGAVLPPGTVGRLRIRAPGLAREYFGDPLATANAFRDGWFYPNDVGTVTEDGTLVITGRADDLINVGGSKYAPEIIESVLLRVAGVRDAAAFGISDALGKDVVHAAIVTDGDVDVDAIEAAFRAAPGVPPPSVVLRVPELPRNDNGKINRAGLAHFVNATRTGAGSRT